MAAEKTRGRGGWESGGVSDSDKGEGEGCEVGSKKQWRCVWDIVFFFEQGARDRGSYQICSSPVHDRSLVDGSTDVVIIKSL